MQISAVNVKMPFGRTLTKNEEKELIELTREAKKELNTGMTSATVFDFSFPKLSHDTGIGTSFSDDAQEMAVFLKTMFGINSIQLQPQGQISNSVRSPYSGTSFSLGMHIIDINKLTGDKYGNILRYEDLNNPYMNKHVNDIETDYDNVFSENGQKIMLKKAYDNFVNLNSNSELKQEFEKFKQRSEYWLEKDALFDAATVVNGSYNINNWSLEDQNLFAQKEGNIKRIEELKQVTDEEGRNIVDFEEFVQFIADKQQQESKKEFNKKGIDIFGDCQIGFSQKDVWAHKSAFDKELEFGCNIGGENFTCWSPAIDFNKLDGDAGELLRNKFDLFFKRYDGVRIDAAWQLVNPLLVYPLKNEQDNDIFDNNGNKLGNPVWIQPRPGSKIIKDIILKSANDNGIKPEKILLENLGGQEAYDSLEHMKNSGMTLIHLTKYAGDNWGRVKYYETQGYDNYQNMKPGDYTIGPGTHDDESLVRQYDNNNKECRAWHLSQDLGLDFQELKNTRGKWIDAAFAELFTTRNQFATLPDLLGSSRRINTPDVQKGNWEYRAGNDYKKTYQNNLSNGSGLNLPDALSKALKSKGIHSLLTERLDYYANVLREREDENKKLDVNF